VIQSGSDKLDVRSPVTAEEILDVHHIVKGLPDRRILELPQESSRQAHMKPGYILITFQHSGRTIVTPQNLLGLPPFFGIVQGKKISERLVHIKP
jgi:hypothetical protein